MADAKGMTTEQLRQLIVRHGVMSDPESLGASTALETTALPIALERDALRTSLAEMHRRAQTAESIIAQSGIVEGRPQGAEGRSLGRALANYGAAMYRRERDDLAAKLRAVEQAFHEMGDQHGVLQDDRERALRIGYELTLDTQTCEEMAASLVEMTRAAQGERDALAAEVARLRAEVVTVCAMNVEGLGGVTDTLVEEREALREKAARVRAEWDAVGWRRADGGIALHDPIGVALDDLLNALGAKEEADRGYPVWKQARVLVDPAIMAGTPCFAGTRVPVSHVGGLIRGGLIEEVREDFPYLTEDDLAWSPKWLVEEYLHKNPAKEGA